jgi:hypothetical protein
MAGIGIAKKGLGLLKQAFKSRGRKPGVLDKVIGKGVVDRNVKSKDVFKIIKGLKKDKRIKAVGKGALVGGAVASGLEYKRRKDRGDYKK